VFETRRIDGKDTQCVLIDSVQSQANRLEEALLGVLREGRVTMPHVVVDFTGASSSNGVNLSDLGEITSLQAPHRIFDAVIRDSELDGVAFTETEHYTTLLLAKPANALQVFRLDPSSLLFGAWNSTGEGGGMGAKFARCIVSEITGVSVAGGQKGAVRIDPLGIRADVKVTGSPLTWKLASGEKGEKALRPSEIVHSNIISNLVPGGVTIDYAVHTAVITCAGLRRLRFPGTEDEDAGRAVLAALALVALTQQDQAGYALRSRCDLVCDGAAPLEIVHPNGRADQFEITADDAVSLLTETVAAAKKAGFPWHSQPIRLVPQKRLVELVAQSRAKGLAGETESESE
jgi:CRISPR-associated protein Csb1